MADWCLITDIDGTLIGGCNSARELRAALLQERRALAARGARLYWVIATGRGVASTREVLADQGFRDDDFDAFITSVGAELHWSGQGGPCRAYASRLGAAGFERGAVLEALGGLGFLKLQAGVEQLDYKVSYHIPDTPRHRQRVHEALAPLPFPTQTIFSHDEYLDVAPSSGGKGGAVAHLLELWKLPRARAIAAGDSGNDANMLEQDWHGIVVGNGRRQLQYLRARPNVYFATSKYAAGVHEGLVALGFLAKELERSDQSP